MARERKKFEAKVEKKHLKPIFSLQFWQPLQLLFCTISGKVNNSVNHSNSSLQHQQHFFTTVHLWKGKITPLICHSKSPTQQRSLFTLYINNAYRVGPVLAQPSWLGQVQPKLSSVGPFDPTWLTHLVRIRWPENYI